MKLTWSEVECAKCKSCLITRHGKPRTPDDFACKGCLGRRMSHESDAMRTFMSNISRIVAQFVHDDVELVLRDCDDYLEWIGAIRENGRAAVAAIEGELTAMRRRKAR